MLDYIIIILISSLASLFANRGIAVFNDGLRPIIPEYLEGRISKKSLAATSFALSFGLVIGFGLPMSIATSILLIHSILLGTDIIGASLPSNLKGQVASVVIGGLYGIIILSGVQYILTVFAKLPVNFLDQLSLVGKPVIIAFAIFPALVVGKLYGITKGILTVVATFVGYILSAKFGVINMFDMSIRLDPMGTSLLVAVVIMFVMILRDKSEEKSTSNMDLYNVFSTRVDRIYKNKYLIAILGGLIAVASSLLIIAEGPISQALIQSGSYSEATFASLARAISFIPLVATTAITTGVYSPAGMKFVFVIGLLFIANPIVAFFAGAIMIFLEVIFLRRVAGMLDSYPAFKKSGDYIRDAMTKVLEVALLVGGALACYNINPTIGMFILIGALVFNQISKRKVADMVIGPMAAIITGIVVNIFTVLGLM